MKKITLLLLMSTLWGYAQIKNYTFSQSVDYFSPITGGTLLGDAYSDDQRFLDPAVPQGHPISNTGVGLPIGFNFVFNGYAYDRFAINTNGWISLGSSALSPSVNLSVGNSYAPLSSTSTAVTDELSAKICALGMNLQGQTGSSLRFQTIGSSPNQTLVVQWINYKKSGGSGAGDSFSFQIRLNETSNTVDIIYGTVSTSSATNASCQVGMRAEPAATATNFVCRSSAEGWDYTEGGTLASASVVMNNQLVPYSGLIYTWTPPTCGGAKGLLASSVTTNSASLNWGGYIPVPSGYEYVVSTSLVLPTGSGTVGTGVNVSISNLSASTLYNVFLRTKCGSAFTPWTLAGSFKTKCTDALSIIENFDTYPVSETSIPNCWSIAGNGQTYIYSGGATPGSAPNRLYMFGDGNSMIPTVAYAVLPPVSNLHSATHRLRLKAHATTANRKLDVGYFTNNEDVNTFVLLESISLASTTASSAVEYTIAPSALSAGIKNLVFKNSGAAGPTQIFIDDVIWEPIPNCPNVSNLKGNVASNSVNLSWTAGGSETAWQYAYGPSSVIDPSTLAPVNAEAKSIIVGGLNPSSSYKIWVRSKCHDDLYGAWIGPVTFTTTCVPVAEFAQNFDASTVFPSCWGKLGTTVATGVTSLADSSSSPNSLFLYTSWNAPSVITVMPPLSNSGVGSHRLRFKFRGSEVGAKIDLGYLTDVYDADSFVLIESFVASSATAFEEVVLGLGSVPASPYLAFRVSGTTTQTFYIDDVFWEPIPTCHDISGLSAYGISSASASLTWTAGDSEKAWQYVLGASTDTNPDLLNPVDVTSKDIKIDGLTVNASYKVWVRSKCSGTNKGVWVGPISFMTTCESVTSFTENFDASASLPSCWKKVGTTGSVFVAAALGSGMPSAPSGSNVLSLENKSSSQGAIVAICPVGNSAEGTHRLRFKWYSTVNNAVLEVGSLANLSDPSTFSLLKTIVGGTGFDFESATAELGLDPSTEVLAFRNASIPSVIFIDDVVWEPIPACAKVSNLKTTEVSSSAIGFSWSKGGSETAWQYAVGTTTDKNPESLTPVNVTKAFAKANGLSPSTAYKIWVRSKCNGSSVGDWVGPIIVETTCAPANAIAENFDASVSFPSCWSKIGSQGSAYVSPVSEAAIGSNILHLYSGSDNAMAVVALPAINDSSVDYLMKFKFKSNVAGAGLEVGYLTNASDPSSFVSFKSFAAASTTLYNDASLDLEGPLPSQVLAFRNVGIPAAALYIDEVSVTEAVLGVDSLDKADFSYYPNPVKDVFSLSFDQEIVDVAVLNLLGQQLIAKSVNSNQAKIDMSDLPNGTYIVKVAAGHQSKMIKVLKE